MHYSGCEMEFLVYRFGDLCQMFAGGDAPKQYEPTRTLNHCYPVFSNGIEKEGLYGYCDHYTIPGNTLTISARGTVGVVYYRSEPFLPIVRLIALILDENKANTKYFYYLLRCTKIDGFGTSQQQITIPFLKRKRIQIIADLEMQKRIASILTTYDNLIEVNNKRIKVLEQMAENLYKEWFVRFRFPDHETAEFDESKIGRIPTSFSILKMEEVFDYYIGGGWGNDDEDKDYPVAAYVIRGTDFPRVSKGDLSTCPLRYHKKNNYASRELESDDIILEISGGTAEQPVGRALLVTENTINRFGGKVICASFCKLIRLNKEKVSPIYFYYWMKYLYDTRIIDRYQLQSTGIINFQFDYFLRKGIIMLPNQTVMDAFDSYIKPLLNEISSLAEQNENLIRQRDLLLPRLMSGKLEV